jgi:vacuolar protein sorting-associated protein IST1
MPRVNANEIEPSIRNYMADVQRETTSQSSDVLERARVAIASAERATIAARAAAELVNVQFG